MRALATLHHPGLVALHDGGVEDGRPFIVTDLVEGPTLAERLESGPARPGRGAAHRRPAGRRARPRAPRAGSCTATSSRRTCCSARDGPRLADFGIARALDGTAVTGTGYVVGTAAYLAPEQVRGEWVGPEADVYALGLVLLECADRAPRVPRGAGGVGDGTAAPAAGIPDGLPVRPAHGAAGDDGAGACRPADRGRGRGAARRRIVAPSAVGRARTGGRPPDRRGSRGRRPPWPSRRR